MDKEEITSELFEELNNFLINMFGYNYNEILQKLQENEETEKKIIQYQKIIDDLNEENKKLIQYQKIINDLNAKKDKVTQYQKILDDLIVGKLNIEDLRNTQI